MPKPDLARNFTDFPSFPVIHKVGNVGIFILLKFENTLAGETFKTLGS